MAQADQSSKILPIAVCGPDINDPPERKVPPLRLVLPRASAKHPVTVGVTLENSSTSHPAEQAMADEPCESFQKLTLEDKKITIEQIVNMEFRLKERYPERVNGETPEAFRARCDLFKKRYLEERERRNERRRGKKDQLRMEVEQRLADHPVSHLQHNDKLSDVRHAGIATTEIAKRPALPACEKSSDVCNGGTPVHSSTSIPACKPAEHVISYRDVPRPSVFPVSAESEPPAVVIKKKYQRPSRRKKVDDRSQTAYLSETFSAELSKLNYERLLVSPPISVKTARCRNINGSPGKM